MSSQNSSGAPSAPDPPEGQSPTLAWHHESYKLVVAGAAACLGLGVVLITLVDGGLDWMTSGWAWGGILFGCGVMLLNTPQRLAAGDDWFRTNKGWVRTYELTWVEIDKGGNGTVDRLILHDTGGRGVAVQENEIIDHDDIYDLVMDGVRYSIRNGADTNREARKRYRW